jgi:hypothetical protein
MPGREFFSSIFYFFWWMCGDMVNFEIFLFFLLFFVPGYFFGFYFKSFPFVVKKEVGWLLE